MASDTSDESKKGLKKERRPIIYNIFEIRAENVIIGDQSKIVADLKAFSHRKNENNW